MVVEDVSDDDEHDNAGLLIYTANEVVCCC